MVIKKRVSKEQNLTNVHAFRERQRDCTYGPPKDYKRRCRLEKNTEAWLRYYLADTFPLEFAKIHKDYIFDLDYIIENGGWKAIVLPRGSGKTTIAMGVALKSILTGKSRYAVMIGAKAGFSKNLIKTFKAWLQHNERLAADYPEVCEPIKHTNGIPQAMKTLTAFGETVYLEWTADKIVLPDCPRITPSGKKVKSNSANAIIDCDGITGAIRGRNYCLPDGTVARPEFCIVDDPQTKESAKSVEQTTDRLEIIKSDIAGLSGPEKDIRIVVPCTIIQEGDLADQISNPETSPDFIGERHPFFISMPENMNLWDKYNEVRILGLAKRDKGMAAQKFYKENQKALDKGAVVSWPERKGDNAINGVQWGMNKYFQLGEKSFQTELQGAPLPAQELIRINAETVLKCAGELSRWIVPLDAVVTTAFIDCNPRTSGLHWGVTSFEKDVSANISAYGRYPDRGVLVPENASTEQEKALLFEGLRKVCEALGKAPLKNEMGQPCKIDLVMIDGGYQFETVVKFVRSARMPFQLAVSRGRAATKYLDVGRDVLKAMPNIHLRKNQKNERYLSHNTDVLREDVHRAFVAGPGAPGGMTIHKAPPFHDVLAKHITSMKLADKAEGSLGIMYKWTKVPGTEDHLLDCAVGCYAGASWLGISSGVDVRVNAPRRGLKIRKMKI